MTEDEEEKVVKIKDKPRKIVKDVTKVGKEDAVIKKDVAEADDERTNKNLEDIVDPVSETMERLPSKWFDM